MSERVVHIANGKITNPTVIRDQFNELKDGVYLVKISPRKVRTLPQNAYYWGVVCEMVRDGLQFSGYDTILTTDDAHEVLKELFLKKDLVNKETGEILPMAGSTATLNTIDFAEYLEKIIRWAAEYLNIVIPYPNEH